MVKKFIFHINTLDNDFCFEIDNIYQIYNSNQIKMHEELLLIFGEKKRNYVFLSNPYFLKLSPIMQMTKQIRIDYKIFIDKYSKKNKKLLSLENNLDKIELDEYFFLSTTKHTFEQTIFISNILKTYTLEDDDKKRAEIFTELQKNYDDTLGKILKLYEVKAFDSSRKNIGEKTKEKRICRFCNNGINTNKKVSFNNKAHVIPEALGNKGLITYEECDECNGKFGKIIEKDLIKYLDIFRVFFGIKGKKGVPKLKLNDKTVIKHYQKKEIDEITDNKYSEILEANKEDIMQTEKNNENLTVVISNNINFNEKNKTFAVPLESGKISTGNIYKALCKMIISLIEPNELKYLQNTISWINSSEEKNYIIPKIASTIIPSVCQDNPLIVFYIRKDENINIPHIVGEFNFKCIKYVFIVPFSVKDKLTFTEDKEFEYFWKSFHHYNYIKNWEFHNMNSTIPKKFIVDMKLEPKNVHIGVHEH